MVFVNSQYCLSSEVKIEPPIFIAHAGGGINKLTYTNSLEALNSNYEKGFRFFEIDFSWTSDNKLVAMHLWEENFPQQFNVPADIIIPTKDQFLILKTKTGLTQLSLEDVLKWAETKGDVYIISDIKKLNIKALRIIFTNFPNYTKYIIPQVYNYKEYDEVINLGYSNIILTLYKMEETGNINLREVLNFAKKKSPFAITMPGRIAKTGLAFYLYKNNTRVYVHTVNDKYLFNSLRRIGVWGIYTDFINPS
jgi:glycerophosphoryl diester phosphodiesterase